MVPIQRGIDVTLLAILYLQGLSHDVNDYGCYAGAVCRLTPKMLAESLTFLIYPMLIMRLQNITSIFSEVLNTSPLPGQGIGVLDTCS